MTWKYCILRSGYHGGYLVVEGGGGGGGGGVWGFLHGVNTKNNA